MAPIWAQTKPIDSSFVISADLDQRIACATSGASAPHSLEPSMGSDQGRTHGFHHSGAKEQDNVNICIFYIVNNLWKVPKKTNQKEKVNGHILKN